MPPFTVALVANDLPHTPDWVGRKLAEQGIVLIERECAGASEVALTAADADVVWTMGGSRVITAEILPLLRNCRAILRTGTGTDNIPVAEATRLGIVVANTPEATMHQVAENAIGLLFAVIRQIARQDRLVRQGVWDRDRAWPDWHLVGQTFGLVGFGRIARLVARKILGFELKIIACDPVVDRLAMEEQGVEKVSLDELLSRSDFVSIHVPLSEKSRHTIGEPRTGVVGVARWEPPMYLAIGKSLISKEQFERRLKGHLSEIELDLASKAQQQIGYAWRLIIDHIYRERGDDITFENLTDCAQTIARLAHNLKD